MPRHDVHITTENSNARFELERGEPVKVGDLLRHGQLTFVVQRILTPGAHESDRFDAIVEGEWRLAHSLGYYHDDSDDA